MKEIEKIVDYLSDILYFFIPIFIYLPIYLFPVLLYIIKLEIIALISLAILTIISLAIILYIIPYFVKAKKELDANLCNRCKSIWITICGCLIICFLTLKSLNIL